MRPKPHQLIIAALVVALAAASAFTIVTADRRVTTRTTQPPASSTSTTNTAPQTNQIPPDIRRFPPPQYQPTFQPPQAQQQPTRDADAQPQIEQIQKYLGNLQQAETRKQLISTRIGAVNESESTRNPDNRTGQERLEDADARLRQLINEMGNIREGLSRVAVPAACMDLQRKYLTHITDLETFIGTVRTITASASSNPQQASDRLKALQGGPDYNKKRDNALAAEQSLTMLCDRYHIAKTFRVSLD